MDKVYPYSIFGKTKNLPLNVYLNGVLIDHELPFDDTVWIERPEDWYALSKCHDKRIRIIFREEWLKY